MGTGNKTETSLPNRSSHFAPKKPFGFSQARNLTKYQLGGVIFGTKNDTIKECLFKQIFGLPAPHFSYVKNIEPGLPLFLFNYSDRKLHGIFEAASPGKMNINPYGWTNDGSEKTMFPAQVQIRVRLQCQPLPENQFKPIISDNYFKDHHFWFELDHAQANKLMGLLASVVVAPGKPLQNNTVKWRTIFRDSPQSDSARVESEELSPLDLDADLLNQLSQKSDSTEVLSSLDGENQSIEGQSDVKGRDEQLEKDQIFMKLKDMVLKAEGDRENRSLSLPVDGDNKAIANDNKITEDKDYRKKEVMGSDENASLTTEVLSKDTEHKVDSLDIKYHSGQASDSSSESSIITRLIQEVDELKMFKKEQTCKTSFLEQKLVRAEAEIRKLRRRLVLESEVIPSSEFDNEKINDLNLDPKESIFLVGGYDGESWLPDFGSYYPSQNLLRCLQPMISVRSYASFAQLNGELYLLGGGDGQNWYNIVDSYSIAKDQWTRCPSLGQQKGSLASVGIGNKIFAIGGGNGVQSFSEVEMLDLYVGRWINTRSMHQKRFSLAAVELDGVIYASGGFDGSDYLKSAEMFDPREHSWTKISPMNTRRGCHSMVVLNNKLYAVGGFDGDEMVSSVEVYDTRLGSWMFVEPMSHTRGYSVSAVLNETIYVFGGLRDGSKIVDEVESFKEGHGWKETEGRGIWSRCFHSGIALLQ